VGNEVLLRLLHERVEENKVLVRKAMGVKLNEGVRTG
jgi:hypothetical protein